MKFFHHLVNLVILALSPRFFSQDYKIDKIVKKSFACNPVNPVILSLFFACLFSACSRDTSKSARREWFALGTVVELTLHQDDARHIEAAQRITRRALARVESHLSLFDENSALAAINALAGEDVVTPLAHPFTAPLEFSLLMAVQSGGAFDPTIGPLMRLWGFRGGNVETAPHAKLVAEILAGQTGFEHVYVLPIYFDWHNEVRLERPGMSLDLGAVAKGFAVDYALDELQRAGFSNIMLSLGGDLRVMGSPSATRGTWRAGIRDPFDSSAPVQTFVLNDGEAVATSGNYERFVTLDGVRYAHIIDGRTGYPVTNMASVTVVAPTAMEADALATTLFILGPVEGAKFLERLYPEADALWITDQPDSERIASPNMQQRMTGF